MKREKSRRCEHGDDKSGWRQLFKKKEDRHHNLWGRGQKRTGERGREREKERGREGVAVAEAELQRAVLLVRLDFRPGG